MEGRLDPQGLPVLDLQLGTSGTRITALVDTGFDGELLLTNDQLRAAGIEVVFDRADQVRLADGSEVMLFGTTLEIDWHGEPRAVTADVVPASAPAGVRPLIGCRLLRDSRLEIDFPRGTVRLSRSDRA